MSKFKIQPNVNLLESISSRPGLDYSMTPSPYTSIGNSAHGAPDRMRRYDQYDQMDKDPIIGRALDIIAENCAQNTNDDGHPFFIKHLISVDPTEAEVMATAFRTWLRNTGLGGNRLFSLFRRLIKYGDDVYLRDPETNEFYSIDIRNITKVSFDDTQGKRLCNYYIKNIELNLANKIFAPTPAPNSQYQPSNATKNPAAADGLRIIPGRFD